MSDYPVFTIDCKEYCPDCQRRREADRPATAPEAR